MQQNLLYEESLENCSSYFSHSMGVFFPSDPHPTVYFTIWEMHAFPHQFPIVQENATKPIVWGEPGELVLILSHSMGAIRFPFYGILHHMGNACVSSSISHTMGKNSQTRQSLRN